MDLGPRIGDGIYDCLEHVLSVVETRNTMALEFGVATGTTLNRIAEVLPVVGFDSFQGLPEFWRTGFDKGMFAQAPPEISSNALLKIGLFSDTLPGFQPEREISLVHIDCDLYSSTVMALWHLTRLMNRGYVLDPCYLVFDEFYGYQDDWSQTGEAKAFEEWVTVGGIEYEAVGHGPEQLVVKCW